MKYKTDYAGHERVYRRNKRDGLSGWDTQKDWAEWKKELEAVCSLDGFPRSGKLLELGCGAGDVALLFADRGYSVSGIDIAPTAIEWALEKAKERNLTAEFVVGDVTNLRRWDDETFDSVIDGHCLHCIIGDDRTNVLAEALRVLKPGGLFYVSTMCGDPKEPEVIRIFDPESRCMVAEGVARRYFGRPNDILAEIERAGFKADRHTTVDNGAAQDDLLVWARK